MALRTDPHRTETAPRPRLDTLLPEAERQRTHYLVEQEVDIPATARANAERETPPANPDPTLVQVAEIKTSISRLSLQLTRVEGLLKEVLAHDQSRPIEYDDAPLMQ